MIHLLLCSTVNAHTFLFRFRLQITRKDISL